MESWLGKSWELLSQSGAHNDDIGTCCPALNRDIAALTTSMIGKHPSGRLTLVASGP
jgi:hypothetical protein